jgi:hypothetical protein
MDIINLRVDYKLNCKYVIPSVITHREIPLEDSIHELDKPYPFANNTLLRNWQGGSTRSLRGNQIERWVYERCIP